MTMREILSLGRGTIALVFLMGLGLLLRNPVGVFYNIPWLLPFLAAPLIIHHYCGPGTQPRSMANGGRRDLLADPRLMTSLDGHPERGP